MNSYIVYIYIDIHKFKFNNESLSRKADWIVFSPNIGTIWPGSK